MVDLWGSETQKFGHCRETKKLPSSVLALCQGKSGCQIQHELNELTFKAFDFHGDCFSDSCQLSSREVVKDHGRQGQT